MRPAHLRVFDGLRVTTEHMEHLQASLHSAVEDVREVLGLGRVQRGFEVVAAGENTVVVQPGLAFDAQRRRIACDEPITLAVQFEPGEAERFVSIVYEQFESGQVEGHYTLVWERCAVQLRSALPPPTDPAIAIARVSRNEDGTIAVESLIAPGTPNDVPADPGSPRGAASATPDAVPGSVPNGSPPGDARASPAEPSASGGGDAAPAPATAAANLPLTGDQLPDGADAPDGQPAATPPAGVHFRLAVRQGVARIAADPTRGGALAPLLLEPLRQALAGGAEAQLDLHLSLGDHTVEVPFPVASLTCRTLAAATVTETVPALPDVTDGTPSVITRDARADTAGEATFEAESVSQFGVLTAPPAADGGPSWLASAWSERAIAELLLHARDGPAGSDESPRTWADALRLVVRVEAAEAGFTFVVGLEWKGAVHAEAIAMIETVEPTLDWQVVVGWKALGKAPA